MPHGMHVPARSASPSLRGAFSFSAPPAGQAIGFTLIELVTIMLLVGILAVAVLPRFGDLNTFSARSFHDATLSTLRYAQKSAIAQRRTVCSAFTSNSLTLTIASAAGSSTCNTNLNLPGKGTNSLLGNAVSYAATPTSFSYNAAGQPSTGQQLQVAGASQTITIEAETGYVR